MVQGWFIEQVYPAIWNMWRSYIALSPIIMMRCSVPIWRLSSTVLTALFRKNQFYEKVFYWLYRGIQRRRQYRCRTNSSVPWGIDKTFRLPSYFWYWKLPINPASILMEDIRKIPAFAENDEGFGKGILKILANYCLGGWLWKKNYISSEWIYDMQNDFERKTRNTVRSRYFGKKEIKITLLERFYSVLREKTWKYVVFTCQ